MTDNYPSGLTRIRLHAAIHFCLHRGKCPLKGGRMASAFTVLQPVVSFEPPGLGPFDVWPASGAERPLGFSRNAVGQIPCPVRFLAFYLGKCSKKADMGSICMSSLVRNAIPENPCRVASGFFSLGRQRKKATWPRNTGSLLGQECRWQTPCPCPLLGLYLGSCDP